MSVIQRLDVAIQQAQLNGHDILEVDINQDDYADLMKFAAEYDESGLRQIGLDMLHQTYHGYKLVVEKGLPESGIILDSGAQALPIDEIAESLSKIQFSADTAEELP